MSASDSTHAHLPPVIIRQGPYIRIATSSDVELGELGGTGSIRQGLQMQEANGDGQLGMFVRRPSSRPERVILNWWPAGCCGGPEGSRDRAGISCRQGRDQRYVARFCGIFRPRRDALHSMLWRDWLLSFLGVLPMLLPLCCVQLVSIQGGRIFEVGQRQPFRKVGHFRDHANRHVRLERWPE